MPSHYNKKPRNHPNGGGISRQSKIPKIPKMGRIGMVGDILKKVGSMLGSSKARRLDDRRKADKGIEYRRGSNGHDITTKASERVRVPGQPESGRRSLEDRRRDSQFNIEKRKGKDLGKIALKITPPAVATAVAVGVYSRKNKDKNNGKVETEPDLTIPKLRQLKPYEIEDRFHSGVENPRTNPPARTKLSGVSKEKARRDRINTERILRMKR